jgi:hypothetical protein
MRAMGSPRPKPRWFLIPVRVVLVTFLLSLITFAVTLLLGILGLVAGAHARQIHPDMRMAYRHVALPSAAVVGAIVLVSSIFMELRHYRQAKALASIEHLS